jgi:hypothetical protein
MWMTESFQFGGEIVWRPTPEHIDQAHLTRFMRRVIRAAYLGLDPGEPSSLINPDAVEEIYQAR